MSPFPIPETSTRYWFSRRNLRSTPGRLRKQFAQGAAAAARTNFARGQQNFAVRKAKSRSFSMDHTEQANEDKVPKGEKWINT